jgi:hypothetical protein
MAVRGRTRGMKWKEDVKKRNSGSGSTEPYEG